MGPRNTQFLFATLLAIAISASSARAQVGSIRGSARDADLDTPLSGVKVRIAETGAEVITNEDGNYSFGQVAPGKYTLVFTRDGFNRQVKAETLVNPGAITEVSAAMT